ncbi:MAG: hypothetical protein QOK39_1985 [Acidimicrobiaceae bacterium]|jgi:hypothetical protein|nr:hypothetical protein [Acidimicrobiaceae bacterium]
MDVANAGQWVILMLSPTLLVAGALCAPRVLREIRRFAAERRPATDPQPTCPPIEQLAADLRRLLQRHDDLKRSTTVAMRAQKLRATEAAIADCSIDAARALDLPCPDEPGHRALALPELRRLLLALEGAGLVLQPLVSQFAADERA